MVELNDILNLEDDGQKQINEAVTKLFEFKEPADIKTKTELTLNDVVNLTRLKTLSDCLNIDILNKLCDTYCLFMVSHNRQGRGEVVRLMVKGDGNEKEKTKGLFNKVIRK